MKLAFDIETDGLLRDFSQIHCLVTKNLETGEVFRYDDTGKNESIVTGVQTLLVADELWGHNIISYDFEILKSIFNFFNFKGKVYDTLILSRMFFTDMLDRDFRNKPPNMPAQLYGRHSLKSWGYRLGVLKSEYGDQLEGDWSTYTPEMLEYCAQDVEVSDSLHQLFASKLDKYETSITTEHELAKIMSWQERGGFPFDINKAHKLEGKLRQELEQLSDEMRSTFLFVDGGEFTPKRPNKTKGYVAGATFNRLKEFNPTSRHHIAFAFQTFRGWEPIERTDTGKPKIDEKVLMEIDTKESKKFARILELQKHLGQLSEGQNAWLKRVEKDGRIRHSCILNTNTGRNCHMRPNLGQVGQAKEYRELFYPGTNYVQLGADASGLELRCLGHYLTRYDGGFFSKEVVEGDIHTTLSNIYFGKKDHESRKKGKSCTYCLIYGGGNIKLGLTSGASKAEAGRRGAEIRDKILTNLNGFKGLNEAITERAKHGVITAIDGRPIRLLGKKHAALNYLLQSCGSVICKMWVIRSNILLKEAKIVYQPLAFIHDEMQLAVKEDQVKDAEFLIKAAMKDVQTTLHFRCELDSETKVGSNWSETH